MWVCGEPVLYESVEKLVGKVVGKLWKGVLAFPRFINTLSIAYPCWNAGYPYIHALIIICKMLEVYFMEYFVEYFAEKKILFTKKRCYFGKRMT